MISLYKNSFLKRLTAGGVCLLMLILFLGHIGVIRVHEWTVSDGIKHLTGAMSSLQGKQMNEMWRDSTNSGLTADAIIPIPDITQLIEKLHTPLTYNGQFSKSAKGNLLNTDPPNFLTDFKNPCWFEKINLTDVQQKNLQSICFKNIGKNNKICKTISKQRLRCLPYFMLIGTPKSGSTDLYRRIIDHPDVLSCSGKEPHWWARKRNNKVTFSMYVDRFSECASTLQFSEDDEKSTLVTGEGSQSTLWDNTWWWRYYPENLNDEEPGLITANFVRHILPRVKLLVILRNPVDRLYSGYLFFKKNINISAEDFHRRASNEVTKFNKCLTEHSLRHCVYKKTDHEVRLHVGLYAVYLKDWINVFSRNQIHVLQLEDYSSHMQRSMSKVYSFLKIRDLSEEYGNKSGHSNTRKKKTLHVGKMLNKTRVLLDAFYRPFNKALAKLLNDSRFLWQS